MKRVILLVLACLLSPCVRAAEPTSRSLPPPPQADLAGAPRYTVFAVIDGERIRLVNDDGVVDVSLSGVELPPARIGAQLNPLRAVAVEGLRRLLESEEVAVKGSFEKSKIAKVNLYRASDGLWLNLECVRQGAALINRGEAGGDADLFTAYEAKAKETGNGIWAPVKSPRPTPTPITPTPITAPASPPSSEAGPANAEAQSVTVYVTRTGDKYHTAGCSYLRSSSSPLPLAEALKKYTACSRCHPPVAEPANISPSSQDPPPQVPSASPPTFGDRVPVKGYYRKDGTYVRPHTRSRPRK